jgi:ATP-dependent DNA helicase RecG
LKQYDKRVFTKGKKPTKLRIVLEKEPGMESTESKILEMIRKGEGLDLEFKTCRNQLNRDAYKTVCAFLNRHGGTLLLGVQDNGVIQGIEPDAVAQIRKDFVTAINNPQKIPRPPIWR